MTDIRECCYSINFENIITEYTRFYQWKSIAGRYLKKTNVVAFMSSV